MNEFAAEVPNVRVVAQAGPHWCFMACAVSAWLSLYPEMDGSDTTRMQAALASSVFRAGDFRTKPVSGPGEYLRWLRRLLFDWRMRALPDVLDAVLQRPCPWPTLVRRIRRGRPVIMSVNYPGAEEPFGKHTLVVCGVSRRGGVRRLSIMDPAAGGHLYRDSVTYEEACSNYGNRLPGSGRPGWRWVNTHTCSRRMGGAKQAR